MSDFKKRQSYYMTSTILSGLIVVMSSFPAKAGELKPTLDALRDLGQDVPASVYVVQPDSPSLADFSYKDYSETPEVTRSYGVWLNAWDLSNDEKIQVGSSGVDISVPIFDRTENMNYQVVDPYDNVVSGDVTDENGIFNGTDFAGKTFIDRASAKEGGAIYAVDNTEKDVDAYFFNNKTNANKGGAIYNGDTLGHVEGAFAGNQALGNGTGLGGAIYNNGTVDGIDADFFDNHAISESLTAGGGIYNFVGMIDHISGNFVGNTAESTLQGIGSHVQSYGGAIYNSGSSFVGDVTGHFVGNLARAADAEGGAIYNSALMGDVTGDFIGNRAEGLYDYAKGGAIMNATSVMGDITGDFISNTALATYAGAYGGAIANFDGPQLYNITGHFVDNKAEGYYAEGGAIANYYDTNIEKITGHFINNSSIATAYSAYGGGLSNSYHSTIDEIEGDFIGNHVSADNMEAYGGAISNFTDSTIGKLNGNFGDNKAEGDYAEGGAISNYQESEIGEIKGQFVNNQAYADSDMAVGGAIANTQASTIDVIEADFEGNKAVSETNEALGGAIINADGEIGRIEGDFTGNKSISDNGQAYGGAIANSQESKIALISGQFVNNQAQSLSQSSLDWVLGGAIANSDKSVITKIAADFEGNQVDGSNINAAGGAIANFDGAQIDEIDGNFTNNRAISDFEMYGGAIANMRESKIGLISGQFVNNRAQGRGACGGAIFNDRDSRIEKITGNFIENVAEGTSWVSGGAIRNNIDSVIEEISGSFVGNQAHSSTNEAQGGAIHNYSAEIGNIEADFEGNKAISDTGKAYGGAIANEDKVTINEIEGKFTGNQAIGKTDAQGGAISNIDYDLSYSTTIGRVLGNFEGNKAVSDNGTARGGAIANDRHSTINEINGNFIENKAISDNGTARGGAISNTTYGNYGRIQLIKNSNFIDNSVEGDDDSVGGAIYSSNDLTIRAENGSSTFRGNKVNGKSNAIYMEYATLNLDATDNGQIVFDDDLDGYQYDINLDGSADDGDEVVFNGKVQNAHYLDMTGNVTTHLGENAVIDVDNMSVRGTSNGKLMLDIRPDATARTVQSGVINVAEDVSGHYDVIVNGLSDDGYNGARAKFIDAPNDTNANDESFNVSRVISSPYMWEALRNMNGTESGSVWYLALQGDTPTPDPDPDPEPRPLVTPEVIAGIGMHQAGLDQVRSLAHNVSNKVASGRGHCPSCGIISYGNKKSNNIWAFAEGESLHSQRQVDAKGKIWGLTAGADLQSDYYNTLGFFASYRQGKYDFNGKGSHFSSPIGSQIDMDSYAGGLYYRYDRDMNWVFASLYGGYMTSDVSTDDKVAKFDTDGLLMGASLELGHDFAIANGLLLEPSLGFYYNQINFDDAKDNVGKKYKWDGVRQTSLEAGLKLEKQFSHYSKLYIKPSVIKSYTYGDKAYITGLPSSDTIRNQILGRIEAGGRFGFTKDLSGYAWTNYTFGQHYDATAAGAGLNYSW